MSIYGMMRTSVSGMSAQADRLSTVADNVANAGTTGYKRSFVEFNTQVLASSATAYNSGSVRSVAQSAISQQGAIRGTNSPTDLAISGDGFFIVKDGDDFLLTRAGAFVTDRDGNLVNSAGYALLGYPVADDGVAPVANGFAGLEPININHFELKATPSTAGDLVLNLPADADIVAAADLPSTNSVNAEYAGKTSLLVYNSLGNEMTFDFYYSKTAANTWEMTVYERATPSETFPYGSGPVYTSALDFDPNTGLPLASTPQSVVIPIDGAASLDLDISGTTQFGSNYSILNAEVNGNAPAVVERIEFDGDGTVYGIYQNGYSERLYVLPLADVASPDHLRNISGNAFSVSIESGDVIIGMAESDGRGTIISGALEESNVDLASELTIMIESQRSYTANSKVFQTGSDLMDVLISLKR